MDEFASPETQAELENLGVTLLGAHGSAYKARLPLDVAALKRVVELPYVVWVGYSRRQQKVDSDLKQLLADGPAAPQQLPVIVNLFDDDASGTFKQAMASTGAHVGRYDPDLHSYRVVASPAAIEALVALDFVLLVEPMRLLHPTHDESMPAIGVDYIRPGAAGPTYDGSSAILGIMDTGFMVGTAAATMHDDLDKWSCGWNFTTDAAGVWNDENGHGTHVLATVMGTGTADDRYRGVAMGIAGTQATSLRAAKVFDSTGGGVSIWAEDGMDYMSDAAHCNGDSQRPHLVSFSGGGSGIDLVGTDSLSRKLDAEVWSSDQLYVVAAGNDGPGAGTVNTPGVAKNALTVGNVYDYGHLQVGDIEVGSSRGPTGDGRMKPNVVAPGIWVRSAEAGTTDGYVTMAGTSMATPHVSGLAATLLQHFPDFEWSPHTLRAYLMATSILHDDVTNPGDNGMGGRNTYGLGRVSSSVSHRSYNNVDEWSTHWWHGTLGVAGYIERSILVYTGTQRLVVVASWTEPQASAGAASAVLHDLDLWVDEADDCVDPTGACGEWASQSDVDNVEYAIIENPNPGSYAVRVVPVNGRASGLPVGVAAVAIRGDPTPAMSLGATTSTAAPALGDEFTVTTTVSNPSYIASGVHLELTSLPAGLVRVNLETVREDGIAMETAVYSDFTLGNIRQGDTRSAVWTIRGTSLGEKTLSFRAWSENGGTQTVDVPVKVSECWSDADCSDGQACNGAEACVSGICLSGTPLTCDDGNVCNGVETCDEVLGCQAGTPLACDDGNACNGVETCDGVLGCQAGTPLVCDDGNVCNGTETCDSVLGCQAGMPLVCDDGNVCNGSEVCGSNSGCQPGSPLDCEDVDDCTADGCDAVTGCFQTPIGGCTSPVVVPAAGDLLVTDSDRGAVLRVDTSSGDRTVVTSPAVGGGAAIESPGDIGVGEFGDAYVGTPGVWFADSLVHVAPTTGLRSLIASDVVGSGSVLNMCGLDVALDGSVLTVNDCFGSADVRAVDPGTGDRSFVSGCEDAGCTLLRGAGPLFDAWRAVAMEPGGTILVGEFGFTTFEGNLLQVDPVTGDRVIVSGPGEYPSGAPVGSGPLWNNIVDVVGGPGRVAWVAGYEGNLYRVDLVTGDRTIVSGGTGPSLPGYQGTGLTRAADGTLFVSDSTRVLGVDPTTGDRWVVSDASMGAGTTFLNIGGIALVPEPDSDGDGLRDIEETLFFSTDPGDADSDDDGLDDGEEVNQYGTDPNLWDSDGDGSGDGAEVANGADPSDPQSSLRLVELTLVSENQILAPVTATGTHLARVSTDPAGIHLSGLDLQAGLLSAQATLAGPVSVPTVLASFANGAGSFSEGTSGSFGGVMPVPGSYRLCLVAGCSLTAPIPLTQNGTRGVGIGGPPIVATAAGVTLSGAPWTVGTTSVTTASGMVAYTGFVHGPLSASSLSSVAAAAGGGVVQLVTASLTTSGTLGAIAGVGTLTIRFIPEPAPLLGLLPALALLAGLGWRARKRR